MTAADRAADVAAATSEREAARHAWEHCPDAAELARLDKTYGVTAAEQALAAYDHRDRMQRIDLPIFAATVRVIDLLTLSAIVRQGAVPLDEATP